MPTFHPHTCMPISYCNIEQHKHSVHSVHMLYSVLDEDKFYYLRRLHLLPIWKRNVIEILKCREKMIKKMCNNNNQ